MVALPAGESSSGMGNGWALERDLGCAGRERASAG